MFIAVPATHTKLKTQLIAKPFAVNPLDIHAFWENVRKTDRCWWWIGQRGAKGYGKFRGVIASRYSFALHYYSPPLDMCVCHTCDNPSCVRPDHLVLGTQHENALDKANKGRSINGDKTQHGPLTNDLVMLVLELGRAGLNQDEISRAIPCRSHWVKVIRSQYPKADGGIMESRFKNCTLERFKRR